MDQLYGVARIYCFDIYFEKFRVFSETPTRL